MTRVVRNALLAGLVALAVFSAGCQRKVAVETGARVQCSYGHAISDDVSTVKVPVKEAVDHYVRTEVITCEKHAQAEKLFQEAQKAIEAGDLDTAREKLKQVIERDPRFANAASQLSDLNANKKPRADSGGGSAGGGSDGGSAGGDSADSGDDDTSVPAGKLTVWTPDVLEGYKGQKQLVDVFTVTRDYQPADRDSVALMVILAEQQRTAAGAEALMAKLVKQPCPYDAAKVTVNGRQAYFGTDGTRLATLSFIEGPVMVAIQMATIKPSNPAGLKPALIAVAKQLP